jgi:Flp pilus assembly protein TadG
MLSNFKQRWMRRRHAGQGFVEFALIIPLLLLLIGAIIEFGYAMYTWVALQQMARMGVRYAVTGTFNVAYCQDAATALGLTADDYSATTTPHYDCNVPPGVTDYEDKTNRLEDWARMLSVRDTAMQGGAAMLYNPAVSGDYQAYLTTVFKDTFHPNNRGTPSASGYLFISMCSNRNDTVPVTVGPNVIPTERKAMPDPNPYYEGAIHTRAYQFYGVCAVKNYNGGTDNKMTYVDDPGGPGNRVRVTVTYDHPLIVPFFSALWPTLKMTTTQDGIVEKFRTSRVVGVAGGMSLLPTWTMTASITPLPSDTPVPSQTPVPSVTPIPSQTPIPTNTFTPTTTLTPSLTPTSTNTPLPCPKNTGTGLRASYYGNLGSSSSNRFKNLVLVRIDPQVNFDWGSSSPSTSNPIITNDYYQGRWEGWIAPDWPGSYQFYTLNDDGANVWIDGVKVISAWWDQGCSNCAGNWSAPTLLTCGQHTIKIEYYENTGNALMKFGWSFPMIAGGKQIVPRINLYPLGGVPATSTVTNTPLPTNTPRPPTATFTPLPPTKTFTAAPPTNTPPPAQPTNTPKPSNTPVPTITPTFCLTPSDLGGCH